MPAKRACGLRCTLVVGAGVIWSAWCTSRNSGAAGSGFSDIGQKILDRQPNWLIPPTRWRPQTFTHQPIRYRTPTPYPKDDRKRMEEPAETASIHVPEKALIIETPVVNHFEMANLYRKHTCAQPFKPQVQKPQAALTISWELAPRLNRFERVP
ncbi:hypothetical protein N657DRAFT_635448 [Parathielavia appendiculata]|uniref:Secreted protein n=1 Tax=Parathielavia appendiculata TaxID=2587402 RepID=A0AAN6TWF9_9PEZI|nr:hypothetical protein N657DRAFT_635448 [Parathielavia appendiculata]